MAENKPPVSPVIALLSTALDTTWRMFVPIIGGTFAGIGLDHLFSIAPIATVVCLVLGVGVSGMLIVRQLNNVRNFKK